MKYGEIEIERRPQGAVGEGVPSQAQHRNAPCRHRTAEQAFQPAREGGGPTMRDLVRSYFWLHTRFSVSSCE